MGSSFNESDSDKSTRVSHEDMANEIMNGLQLVPSGEKVVTFFGSARMQASDIYYNSAVSLGSRVALSGLSVMTGGGPGAMEAAAKGAYLVGGKIYGINIRLPQEQAMNDYITVPYTCKHLFIRKTLLIKHASAFVILPGGFGTLDEFYDVLTLIVTESIPRVPVVLFGSLFWKGLEGWMNEKLLSASYISKTYFDITKITDDEDEVISIISQSLTK